MKRGVLCASYAVVKSRALTCKSCIPASPTQLFGRCCFPFLASYPGFPATRPVSDGGREGTRYLILSATFHYHCWVQLWTCSMESVENVWRATVRASYMFTSKHVFIACSDETYTLLHNYVWSSYARETSLPGAALSLMTILATDL